MKKTKHQWLCLVVAVILCSSILWMTACQSGNSAETETPTETESETVTLNRVTYTVTVVDGVGEAVTSNLIVKIKKDGAEMGMKPYRGETVSFELPSDSYQVELDLMGADFDYDASACVLSEDSKDLTIQLFSPLSDRTENLFFSYPLEKEYPVHYIGEGVTRVPLTAGDYSFFVFAPLVSAIYNVEYTCDTPLTVSYHGSTFFAQGMDLSVGNDEIQRIDKGLALHIYSGNVGSTYIIGVKSETATECILSIKNVGKTGAHIADMLWTPFTEDSAKVEEHLAYHPEGTYTTVDVTDPTLKAVFNEADGYYHLGTADGPVLFIDLTSDTRFIASVTEICRKQGMGTYIYDDNGTVIEKRSYTELFMQYGLVIDETQSKGNIKVPLTEKLAEAIQVFGTKMNWWTLNSSQNIFYNGEHALLPNETLNVEYAWLLFCGYYA